MSILIHSYFPGFHNKEEKGTRRNYPVGGKNHSVGTLTNTELVQVLLL